MVIEVKTEGLVNSVDFKAYQEAGQCDRSDDRQQDGRRQ
jgi:hypothetical protein